MSQLSRRRTLFASVAIASVSTLIFAFSHSGISTPARRPLKVTYQATLVKPDGTRTPVSVHIRTLAGGQMRRQEYQDGKLYIDQYIGTDGTIYGVSHKRRELQVADFPHKFNLSRPPETAESFMAQKQFHRIEQILGITTYVFRIHDDDGTLVKEVWHAPETDPLTLKEISYRDDGSQHILEATSVVYDNVGEVRPVGYKLKQD